MQHIEVTQHLAVSPAAAWPIFMDLAGWTTWAGVGRVRVEREGDANGVGAIRVFSGGSAREEILSVGPGHRVTYTVLSGAPLRDHLGEAVFTEAADGGTDAIWRCRFESKIPGFGPVIRGGIGWVFRRTLRRLERETKRRG